MWIAQLGLHLLTLLVAPFFFLGVINRVKAVWAGRRGPRLYQTWFDLTRLLRKVPVYSVTATWVFPLAPVFVLATTLTAGLMAPLVPGFAPVAFSGDFIVFAYVLGCGRVFLMLGALDTGSSFEGMGASREATYSALAEPVLLFAVSSLGLVTHSLSFQDLAGGNHLTAAGAATRVAVAYALFVVTLVEAARVPADDPTTHLELTMVHEVMVLDHSGPELAIVQYAAAVKATVLAAAAVAVLNPVTVAAGGLAAAYGAAIGLLMAAAAAIGLIESLTARLRFRTLPLFVLTGFVAVTVAMVMVVAAQAEGR